MPFGFSSLRDLCFEGIELVLVCYLHRKNVLLWAGTQSRRHFALHLWWLSLVHLMSPCSGQYSSSTGWSYLRLLWGDR